MSKDNKKYFSSRSKARKFAKEVGGALKDLGMSHQSVGLDRWMVLYSSDKPNPTVGEWIENTTGKCPNNNKAYQVQLRCRDDNLLSVNVGKRWDWTIENTFGDIIAYREVPADYVFTGKEQTYAQYQQEKQKTLDQKAPEQTDAKFEYIKGTASDFKGAPDDALVRFRYSTDMEFFCTEFKKGAKWRNAEGKFTGWMEDLNGLMVGSVIIAERKPITVTTVATTAIADITTVPTKETSDVSATPDIHYGFKVGDVVVIKPDIHESKFKCGCNTDILEDQFSGTHLTVKAINKKDDIYEVHSETCIRNYWFAESELQLASESVNDEMPAEQAEYGVSLITETLVESEAGDEVVVEKTVVKQEDKPAVESVKAFKIGDKVTIKKTVKQEEFEFGWNEHMSKLQQSGEHLTIDKENNSPFNRGFRASTADSSYSCWLDKDEMELVIPEKQGHKQAVSSEPKPHIVPVTIELVYPEQTVPTDHKHCDTIKTLYSVIDKLLADKGQYL